jgi:hypothetical protein
MTRTSIWEQHDDLCACSSLREGYARVLYQIEFACRCDVGDEKVERHAVQRINMPATETQPVITLVPAFETGKPIGRNEVAIATVLVEGQIGGDGAPDQP